MNKEKDNIKESADDTSQKGSVRFVRTIGELCRVCYTCVRDCPARAIRISAGKAEILPERCICCGNCVKVCAQGAKQIVSTIDRVEDCLRSGKKVAACLAPSFPVEFSEMDHTLLVGMVRQLGFDIVHEVAFGADLVADRYKKMLAADDGKQYIATTCPALIEFVEQYHPGLVDKLAPIVSPMIASARALRRIHGPDIKIVFVGPCIAKKKEAASHLVPGDVDAAITFVELRAMFAKNKIKPANVEASDFDPPYPGLGALFPISRGLLQAADIKDNLLTGDVVAAEGRVNFVEATKELEMGMIDAKLLEVLCCNGCIMGPGLSCEARLFERRARVSSYASRRMADRDEELWKKNMAEFEDLDLSRHFAKNDQRMPRFTGDKIRKVLRKMGKLTTADELNCGACGYETCRDHAVAIMNGLAESEMCLPYAIEQLRKTVLELANSNDQLSITQAALMQAEKLASMGQLAAGIAHEVNNPLGVVLLYSHLLLDEATDDNYREDLTMIAEQAERCKKIVSGLLNFARQNKVVLQKTDLYELVEHGIQTMRVPEKIQVKLVKSCTDTTAEIDGDQIVQALTNLVGNAQDAMPGGGSLTLEISGDNDRISLSVEDTGTGIAEENAGKVFEPFFTTKQIGKGTGLGLAVTYGIVKMHHGDIKFETNTDPAKKPTGTRFTISLPRIGLQTTVDGRQLTVGGASARLTTED